MRQQPPSEKRKAPSKFSLPHEVLEQVMAIVRKEMAQENQATTAAEFHWNACIRDIEARLGEYLV